jgi:nucleotide-binding universal stress UspA family protein
VLKHFLVPLDGSPLAEAALPTAALLAERMSARVTLLHVVERRAPQRVHGSLHLQAAEQAEDYLRTIAAERFPKDIAVDWHVHRRGTDHVAESLADHAEELRPDLILMVTHGRPRPEHWLRGTMAQQLIKENATPVLLVRPDAQGAGPAAFRAILAPLDGQPEHAAGLSLAAELARKLDSPLQLLMVVPTQGSLPGERAATGQLLPATTAELLDQAAVQGAEYLAVQLDDLRQSGVRAAATLARGEPASEIEKAVRQEGIDLVVLSTHGAAGAGAFWSGSLGQKLIARLPVTLLLVPVACPSPVSK